MSKVKNDLTKDIADVIKNPDTNKTYLKGKFLGKYFIGNRDILGLFNAYRDKLRPDWDTFKSGTVPAKPGRMGGFARCFELTDVETKEIYAGKIVSKSMLTKSNQKEKIAQEIEIHRELSHKHIVKFYGFFEDKDNVYIILELCRRRSLMEMHKRRRYLTDRETRYFIRQIALGCIFLHEKHIIHRDLKLGNLFLNDNMEVKVGDFGLATRVQNNERKKTICGTPNYIAPEILTKKGHSYEVDVWSLGCILYTLLVGRPPFETNSLKETYLLIRRNEYHVPSRVPATAKNLIQKMLHPEPKCRPSMTDILNHEYIVSGPIPSRLPTSCLSTIPRLDDSIWHSVSFVDPNNAAGGRKPLAALQETNKAGQMKEPPVPASTPVVTSEKENLDQNNEIQLAPADCYAQTLHDLLSSLLRAKPAEHPAINEEEALDPASVPVFWVSKWVDYTDKYGLGYQLCDNSVGVLFNDHTRIILLTDGKNIQYIEQGGKEQYHTLDEFPESLRKKVTLLHYFRSYMQEHLLKAGDLITAREGDELSRLPYLKAWFRTRNAIIIHLTNGTLQLNFFHDHTKIILCPLLEAVSYINEKKDFSTYKLKKLEQYGCSKDLYTRLRYAKSMLDKLISTADGQT